MTAQLVAAALLLAGLAAQQSPRDQAVLDLTGYWVSVITEDWRWRMQTPPKGDTSGVPLTIEGRKVADQWDPAKDEASGQQCRAYGAAGVMRTPTRLHVTWSDERTMKMEIDNGAQTRVMRFAQGVTATAAAAAAQGAPTWQGHSVAAWEGDAAAPVRHGTEPGGPRDLKVVTTHMRPGYLRKNGVPYSANATLTEYFDLVPAQPNGDRWLVVTSIVEDPLYLTEPFITSTHFRREADGSAWHPTPCAAR